MANGIKTVMLSRWFGASGWCGLIVSIAASLLNASLIPEAAAAQPSQRVLVIYSSNRLLPILSSLDEAFQGALRSQAGGDVEVFNEFFDLERPLDPEYRSAIWQYLRAKYAGLRMDAIVAVRTPALELLLDEHDALFSGVPIVHVGMSKRELLERRLPPLVIGVPISPDPAATVRLAMKLHPQMRKLVVITGAAPFDRTWEALLRAAFRSLESEIKIDYWAGLPLAEILDRVQRLPPDTVVFHPGMIEDGAGERFVPRQVAIRILAKTPVPVYTAYSTGLGIGTMGGNLTRPEEMGRYAADVVARLMAGAAPGAIKLPDSVPNVVMLDARQLRRFGVRDADVPLDAAVYFKEPTLWEAYRREILAGVVVLLLQALLIAALLIERRFRRKAQAALLESEQRMTLVASATGLGMWVRDFRTGAMWASKEHLALLGVNDTEPFTVARAIAAVHPDDRESVRAAVENAEKNGTGYDIRYRVQSADGAVRWVASRGRVDLDEGGRPTRFRGVTTDVTEREDAERQAQQHREELTRLSRIAMLGQLSGSLAHELNQPLTAILSNAHAGIRFLRSDTPDLRELNDILGDIVNQDERAGNVIRRLRALFERGDAHRDRVDLNEAVVQVVGLLRGDLVARHTTVVLDTDPLLPPLHGDRVQLQQLLLNLIINASDAMAETPHDARTITIRTGRVGDDGVLISVSDHGPGVPEAERDSIFAPFVTTKPSGIGLGLSISRSIVTAHGGRIWVERNADGGATFCAELAATAVGADRAGAAHAAPAGRVPESAPAVEPQT